MHHQALFEIPPHGDIGLNGIQWARGTSRPVTAPNVEQMLLGLPFHVIRRLRMGKRKTGSPRKLIQHQLSHLLRADAGFSGRHDVGGAVSRVEHRLDGGFNEGRLLVERE